MPVKICRIVSSFGVVFQINVFLRFCYRGFRSAQECPGRRSSELPVMIGRLRNEQFLRRIADSLVAFRIELCVLGRIFVDSPSAADHAEPGIVLCASEDRERAPFIVRFFGAVSEIRQNIAPRCRKGVSQRRGIMNHAPVGIVLIKEAVLRGLFDIGKTGNRLSFAPRRIQCRKKQGR